MTGQRGAVAISPRAVLRLFLDRLRARSALSADAQAAVLNLPGEITDVRRNEDFVSLGKVASHASLVMDGLVARWGQAGDGERQITALYLAGDMPDLHSLVLPAVNFGLRALSPATILRVQHTALRKAAAFPGVMEAFWRDSVVDGAIATEWVVNVGRRNAQSRIAHLICEIATRIGAGGAGNEFTFNLPVTQHHLADAAGLSVVHVNRSLQGLKKAGLAVLAGQDVQVLDWDGLRKTADFDAAYLHAGRKS
jgi:CRP-like cAMP-binding protein